jgi:acetyltransferase-like isoleucine patch superfamily enzyme
MDADRLIGLAVSSGRCALALRRHGIRPDGRVTCEGRPPVIQGGGQITLGRVAFRGLATPAEVGALPGGTLTIGDNVFINQGATIVATVSITIGDDCRIGDYAAIADSDFHPVEEGRPVTRAPVTLGRNVWLARSVTVLPGARIGDHAVIAAGSVVRGEIPPRVLAAGAPARAVRTLTVSDGWRRP